MLPTPQTANTIIPLVPRREDYEQALQMMSKNWGSVPGSEENDCLQKAIQIILAYEALQTPLAS